MKVKKGDTIIVLSGKDRGKTGVVLEAFPRIERVLVEGINMRKRHQRPTRANQKGQIVEKPTPLHVSNVALVDPKTNKATRVGYKMEGEKKIRIAKKSGSAL